MSMFGDIVSAIFGAPKVRAASAPGSVPSSPKKPTMSAEMPQTASATPTLPPMSQGDVEGARTWREVASAADCMLKSHLDPMT